MMALEKMKSVLLLWAVVLITVQEFISLGQSSVVATPNLRLKVSVDPTTDVVAGDTMVYSLHVSHTEKSYADAVDVELQVLNPAFLVFGSITSSSVPLLNVTKNSQDVIFKFDSITAKDHVTVTMDILVDPYYMLGSRDEVTASSVVKLWYYGTHDPCLRPGSKWNARSASENIRLTFMANKVCEHLLGPLLESQFSASSFYKPNYDSLGNSPHHASFEHNLVWTPADSMTEDIHQYLQIELGQLTTITKVGTRGNGNTDPPSFVKKFLLYHSRDGLYWLMARNSLDSKEFSGNSDSTTLNVNALKIPVEARFLRIVPQAWKTKAALKVKLFGCVVNKISAGCQSLGMSSGQIQDNARLNSNQGVEGWCTKRSSKQTLAIDLENDYVITELAIQSRFQTTDKLINAFYLSYSKDGGAKIDYRDSNGKKTFLGNPVEDTTIRHKLAEAIKTRHVYIEPKELSATGCLRIELYGYKEDDMPRNITEYCNVLDFENGGLTDWSFTGSAFNNQPTFFDNLHARTGQEANFEGAWWIGTKENRQTSHDIPGHIQGNSPTGTLISPAFLISFSKLFFLFAGTAGAHKARVELIVDGTVLRREFSETGNESMVQKSWDVGELVGKEARIRLVDNATDGFISFDGLKSDCHPTHEQLPVFEKSFLLNPSSNVLYTCQFSHISDTEKTGCRFTPDNGLSWKDISGHVSSLLGVDKASGMLYGVSKNRQERLESSDWTGKSWSRIDSIYWDRIKNAASMMAAVQVPHIPVTGLPETDDPSSVLTVTADNSDQFSASSRGLHYKPSGGGWKMILAWSCKEYPDVCISSPCNNGGICNETTVGNFSCTCPQGYTGAICDNEIDDCEADSCLNGGTCLDGLNKFYCVCNSFFTGPRCEKNIDDCASSPCSQGAQCIDGLGNFTCECADGFVGEFCELEMDECASVPCQNGGLCVDAVSNYSCHCRKGYYGRNCEHIQASAFKVNSTRSVQYGEIRYVVVQAKLPLDGRSQHQTWCHDYAALCHSLNKTRPTGCDRSFNHITGIHECSTKYDSVMHHEVKFHCPPNTIVPLIAKEAGYASATADNSFAFSYCDNSNCTNILPDSGCHGALTCINRANANREVYTLCSDPDSNFVVEDKKETTFKGMNYLALYVRPRTTTSLHENWCRDYQRLCQSYGKRPTGCGATFSVDIQYSKCRTEYFSVMPADNALGCDNPVVDVIGQNAGLPSTSDRFSFHNCSASGCQKELPSCGGLRCLNHPTVSYHALCTEPQTSFTILDERLTTLNNISFMVIKARLPRDRKSTQENWCRDYHTLCDSYGLHPTGCHLTDDYECTSCRDKYGSIMIGGDVFGPAPEFKVAELAQLAGFKTATNLNSFAFNKCTKCSSVLSTTECTGNGLGCIKPTNDNDVYTVCVAPQTRVDVLETKSAAYNNTAYLVVKARFAENRASKFGNWSMEYKHVCSSFGRHPIDCSDAYLGNSSCPTTVPAGLDVCGSDQSRGDMLKSIAQETGFSDATNSNTVISSYSQSVSSSENNSRSCQQAGSGNATSNNTHTQPINCTKNSNQSIMYLICRGSDSNFDVISTKLAKYSGQTYLVIKAMLPEHGTSRFENWCEDYRRLCYSYGQRPTGCGGETFSSFSSCTSCRDKYDSLMPKDNMLGCPSSQEISVLANQTGFCDATSSNSFAFSFCNDTCPRVITDNELLLPNVDLRQPVHTVCVGSNSSFTVESTRDVSYQGGSYKVVKGTIPSHLSATQGDWCEDYHQLCHSYGLRPVVTSRDSDLTCERKYKAISLRRNELSAPKKLKYLVEMAGYGNSNASVIFAFARTCQDTCFAYVADFLSVNDPALYVDSNVIAAQKYVTYAVCVNSDSNFEVIDSRSLIHDNRSYRILKTRVPQNGLSKFDNWCLDYERLCSGYGMRPVTILGSNSSSTASCIPGYMSVIIPRNRSLNLLSRKHAAIIAIHAGYTKASRDNSFVFGECNPESCPRQLTTECSSALDCLTSLHSEVYTLCTDSDSNFVVEQTRHMEHQGVPYLLIQAKLPDDGLPRHENWCSDYQHLCNSFGMQPTGCGTSWDTPGYSRCITDYQSSSSPVDNVGCGEEAVTILRRISERNSFKNDTMFVFKNCDSCSAMNATWLEGSCDDAMYCRRKNGTAVTICSPLRSHLKVMGTKQFDYDGVDVTVAQAKLLSSGSWHDNWCHDYHAMCSSLGKRPFSCASPADMAQYKNREQYNTYLSFGACPSFEGLTFLANQAGFPLATQDNILPFINCTSCTKRLKQDVTCVEVDELVRERVNLADNSTNCCKCSDTTVDFNNTLIAHLRNESVSTAWKKCIASKLNQYSNQTLRLNCSSGHDCVNETLLANNSCKLVRRCSNATVLTNRSCEMIRHCFNGTLLTNGSCDLVNYCLNETSMSNSSCQMIRHCLNSTLLANTSCELVRDCLNGTQLANASCDLVYYCINDTLLANNSCEPISRCLSGSLLANASCDLVQYCLNNTLLANKSREWVSSCSNDTTVENTLCEFARDCLNDTTLANNSCGLLSKCVYGNCYDCCACNYTTRNVCYGHMLMTECSPGTNCSDFTAKLNQDVYTFCTDYSDSNFEVLEKREVTYSGSLYTVVRTRIPSHGSSKGETWCKDYQRLCADIGKRPIGCGKDAEVLKKSRDCRVQYDAVMIDGISCPGSQDVADIALHAGFSATVNQSVGLWNCENCSSNFSVMWSGSDSSSDVYAACLGSDSNFNVFEKRVTEHHRSPVTVIMATVPDNGLSLHEDWCQDYSRLCQSYGLRPVGCGRSKENVDEHAQCRDRYEALMFSDDSIDCSENGVIPDIAQKAGFNKASSNNSFMFGSCLHHHCTKFLPSTSTVEHALWGLVTNSSDRVVYTLCASSDSAFDIIATKSLTVDGQDYLSVRARIPAHGKSKYEHWCRDYERLCEGHGMQPLACEGSSLNERKCLYNYQPLLMAASGLSCPVPSGVVYIAQQAGFDDVSSSNTFAFENCDVVTSCVAKIPNTYCWNDTEEYSVFNTVATLANITRVEYVRMVSTNETGVLVNRTTNESCFILPNADPPYTIDGTEISDLLKNRTCQQTFELNSTQVNISSFYLTVSQTFENILSRIKTSCRFNSASSLARMSGEVNTACLRPSVGTNLLVRSTRKITYAGREYLVIKAKLSSSASKSVNWCADYKNLCQSFGSSPIACPREYGFKGDYFKCIEDYEAIMMTDVDYNCPSNGFISQLANTAGYRGATSANSFALFNCAEGKCESTLPAVGCSESVHCLNEKLLSMNVYTACLVANSDSNFNVIEKRPATTSQGRNYTVIRSKIPADGRSLHATWCLDYQRLCESINLRPVHCASGLPTNECTPCKEKYNAVSEESKQCPINVRDIATSAGFIGPTTDNSFSFHRCDSCSRVLSSSHCDSGVRCLKSGQSWNEVYTICGDARSETNLAPVATRQARLGNLVFRIIQARLTSSNSTQPDWGQDYENLCKSFGELPTGCGLPDGEKHPGVNSCNERYSSYLLPGGELGCDPNAMISKLARDAGFVDASADNSFGFSSCDGSASSRLSTSCNGHLACLTWQQADPIVYTACVKAVQSNFNVISTKTVNFLQSSYTVVKAMIPPDGRSLHSNWCYDYQKLCAQYGMRPTGCGVSAINDLPQSTCGSRYGSYMPASDALGCGDSKVASSIARRAGYTNSITGNTFVFNDCQACSPVLGNTSQCDGALTCINNVVWKREVYTLCVDPATNFNVARTVSIQYSGAKLLVIEARLPPDGRSLSENWCREYGLLCKSYNKRPVSCRRDDVMWDCASKYQSVTMSNISCDSVSTDVAAIAISAGFTQANHQNSFILNECGMAGCFKDLSVSECDQSLSCIDSSIVGNVYTICSEDTATFKPLNSRKISVSGTRYTVVSAFLSQDTPSNWCADYTKLCHSVGQSPVVLASDVVNEESLICRDEYDGFLSSKGLHKLDEDNIYDLAVRAGYSTGAYGNTFAFKSCSGDSCSTSPLAYNCSNSLHCLNGVARERTVYGVCTDIAPISNFYVLDSVPFNLNNTKYTALRVHIPVHRHSKYDSWCRDYEHLCHSYGMRPLTTQPSLACQLEYFGIFQPSYDHLTLVDHVKKAGFHNVSSETLYYLQQCGSTECSRTFQLPYCVTGSCSNTSNQMRAFYALCSSVDESSCTNFEVQEVRNVWSRAPFLVARVKLPSHGLSKQENWCKEYQTFCRNYGRRPYTLADLTKKETFEYGACYWKYNSTSYRVSVSSSAIVARAGFSPSSQSCVSSLYHCFYCDKHLDSLQCPLENCQAAVKSCPDFYIICT